MTDRQAEMTDVIDLSAQMSSESLTDPQRCDGDLQWLEVRGSENSSPEGWRSSPQQERENWTDKRNDEGSLADDEDDEDVIQVTWMSEKARQAFIPNVMIVKPQEDLNESSVMKEEIQMEQVPLHSQNIHTSQSERFYPQWIDEIDKHRGTHLLTSQTFMLVLLFTYIKQHKIYFQFILM